MFGPSLKIYLEENNLHLKSFFLRDNALAHPPNFKNYVSPQFDFITAKFLAPNMIPFMQSMDQNIISDFEKLYTKALLQRCFQVTSKSELTIKEFWKIHFNIIHSLSLIYKTSQEDYRTMNSTWRNLWP